MKRLILFGLFVCAHGCFGKIAAPKTFTTHGVCILLDPNETAEDSNNSSSDYLFQPIEERANCVIVTIEPLMRTMLERHYFKNDAWTRDWIVRKDGFVLLLVPRNFNAIPELKGYDDTRSALSANTSPTELEFKVGFLMEHMAPISAKKAANPATYSRITDDKLEQFSPQFVQTFKKIMIPRTAYALAKRSELVPYFAINMQGHGSHYRSINLEVADLQKMATEATEKEVKEWVRQELEKLEQKKKKGRFIKDPGIVSELRKKDFVELLDFFATYTNTRIVFVITCFLGGTNLELVLRKTLESLYTQYPFIFISSALTAAPVRVVLSEEGEHAVNYTQFFKALRTQGPPDIEALINSFHLLYTRDSGFNNVPTIKYPGRPPLVYDAWGVVQIGNVLAKTRTEPLNVSRYFAGRFEKKPKTERLGKRWVTKEKAVARVYPSLLLIYPENIPFTLIFEKDPSDPLSAPPTLVSMKNGPAKHTIAHIDASPFTLSAFLRTFTNLTSLEEEKIFVISKLTVQDDVLQPASGTALFHDVFIVNEEPTASGKRRRVFVVLSRRDAAGNRYWRIAINEKKLAKIMEREQEAAFEAAEKGVQKSEIQTDFLVIEQLDQKGYQDAIRGSVDKLPLAPRTAEKSGGSTTKTIDTPDAAIKKVGAALAHMVRV